MHPNDKSNTAAEDSQTEIISKSELKRIAHHATELGKKLVALNKTTLQQLDLPENILQCILETQSVNSNVARKRQLQYLGKQIRLSDSKQIEEQLNQLNQQYRKTTQQFHLIEDWRDKLIAGGDTAINAFLLEFPLADRQQLRQLIRQSAQEIQKNKAPTAARKLFRYLREIISA